MTVSAPLTERSRRTRAELSRAAHACLAETGALDIDAVVAAAGVSTATFYAHFATHDDALAAALDIALDRIVAAGTDTFDIEALLEHGLSSVIGRLVAASHAAFHDEALVLRSALARLPVHRTIRDVYRRQESRSKEHFARHIRLGQMAGILRDGPSAQRATALLVLLQGINNPMLTSKRLDSTVSADIERAIVAVLAPDGRGDA